MLAERVKQWTEDWKMEGIKEGERKGQAALLQLLLLQRFGSMLDQDVQERLDNATSDTPAKRPSPNPSPTRPTS